MCASWISGRFPRFAATIRSNSRLDVKGSLISKLQSRFFRQPMKSTSVLCSQIRWARKLFKTCIEQSEIELFRHLSCPRSSI